MINEIIDKTPRIIPAIAKLLPPYSFGFCAALFLAINPTIIAGIPHKRFPQQINPRIPKISATIAKVLFCPPAAGGAEDDGEFCTAAGSPKLLAGDDGGVHSACCID